jgi:hypothetical protein
MDAFERELLTPDPPKPKPIPTKCKWGFHAWGKWDDGKTKVYTEDHSSYGSWSAVWVSVAYVIQKSYCIDCNLMREQRKKAL